MAVIYQQQYDPYAGLREAILQIAMGYGKGLEGRRLSDQMAQLMANLPGTSTVESPAPSLGFVGPGAPMQQQEPFDLKKMMSGITDPGIAMQMLPAMMEYDLKSRPQPEKPVKMTLRKGNKVHEIMVPPDEWNQKASRAEELGYSVSSDALPTSPKPFDVQIGDENVTLTQKLDAEGNPLLDDSGQPIYEPLTIGGEQARGPIKVPTVTVNIPKAAPEGERKQLTDLMTLSSDMARINPDNPDSLYNSGYVGVVSGRKGSMGASFAPDLLGVGNDRIEFMQIVDNAKDALLRARSGAQINEQEYKRLVKFLPDYTKPEKTFRAQYRAFTRNLNSTIKQKQSALGESGFIVPTQINGGEVQAVNLGEPSKKSPYMLIKTLNGVQYGKLKDGRWVQIGK